MSATSTLLRHPSTPPSPPVRRNVVRAREAARRSPRPHSARRGGRR